MTFMKARARVDMKESLIKPTDLKNWAYQAIKDSLLKEEVAPGSQLNIETIAARLGVSRTPIREALLRLESEGFVKATSRIGFFVEEITKKDMLELLELREILESYASKKAAKLMNEKDLLAIRSFNNRAKQAFDNGDYQTFMEMEIEIHSIIINGSQNQRLRKMLESIAALTQRERVLSLKISENMKESNKEHTRIIEALEKRDSNLAEKMMRDHLKAVRKRLVSRLFPSDSSDH